MFFSRLQKKQHYQGKKSLTFIKIFGITMSAEYEFKNT